VCSAIGVCLGILVHTALAALGLGAILAASEGLFFALKIVGAVYLVYLGLQLLLSRGPAASFAAAPARLRLRTLVWQGVLSNVTNVKVVVFFIAFLPQFVDPSSAHATRDLAFLGVLYAVLALPVKMAVGFAAGSLSDGVLRSPSALAWLQRIGGAVLVGLGLRLATASR
jgi:threonine/homoserine/homoserine lactone efflux protein